MTKPISLDSTPISLDSAPIFIEGEKIVYQCRKIKQDTKPRAYTSSHRGKSGTMDYAYCYIQKSYRRTNK